MTSDIRLVPVDLSSEQGKICLRKALQHSLSTIFGLPSFKKMKNEEKSLCFLLKVALFVVLFVFLDSFL